MALGLSVTEFWQITFAEYWGLHDKVFARDKQQEPKGMTSDRLKELDQQWGNIGNIRRVSSKPRGRNKGSKGRP